MPLKTARWMAFLSLAMLCCALFYRLFHVTDHHRIAYIQLSKTALPPPAFSTLQQTRRHVRKDIFFSSDKMRKHALIVSPSSVVFLDEADGIKETMENIQGWIQEELGHDPATHEPIQTVCFFTASSGQFSTSALSCHMQGVEMQRMLAKGHTLSCAMQADEIWLSGTAPQAEFQLEPTPCLQIDRLKAKTESAYKEQHVFGQ